MIKSAAMKDSRTREQ